MIFLCILKADSNTLLTFTILLQKILSPIWFPHSRFQELISDWYIVFNVYFFIVSYELVLQTGTGFIKVEMNNAGSFVLGHAPDASDSQTHCKGNPATNEWIPSADIVC